MPRETEPVSTERVAPVRRGAEQRHRVRGELAAAALELFARQGYEETTVDQIAAAAGVARRTFFRYFRSKEEAIFPEHDETVEKINELLAAADPAEAPLRVVCRAIKQVLRMYADSPRLSVERYRLIRQVPTLREREIASVSRYQRLFTRYLLSRFDEATHANGDDYGPMLAEVAAAAVVSAHNHVLRRWLRAGGTGDVDAQLDAAFEVIARSFSFHRSGLFGEEHPELEFPGSEAGQTGQPGAAPEQGTPPERPSVASTWQPGRNASGSDDVLITVARTNASLPRVLATIEAALRDTDDTDPTR